MTINPKLIKILEYLTRQEEDKAKELLHQVFIEKARAIHEEMMSMEDEEMDETVGGSGDMGQDLTDDIEAMEDEIDFEETMSEEEMSEFMDKTDDEVEDEIEVDVTGDEPAGEEDHEEHEDVASLEKPLDMLAAALQELRAEYDRIQSGDHSEEDEAGEEEEAGEEDQKSEGMDHELAESDEEEEQEESMELDEDFDDLAESLDLEVVERDVLKTMKSPKDVGAASSGMTTGGDAKSPLPKSQTTRMGAGPVETGKGPTENGYGLKSAPKSADMGLGDNRRKKSTDGSSKVSKEGNSSALINKSTSDGFGAINNTSPLTKGGQNLK